MEKEKLPTSARPRIPGWLPVTAMLLWWLGGYSAVVYGLVEDRGPFTFLLRWQDALFGGSSVMVGALAAGFVIFQAPALLMRGLRRVWPRSAVLADIDDLMRRAMRPHAKTLAGVHARLAAADTDERALFMRRMRNAWLIFAAGTGVLTLAIVAWVQLVTDADAGRPLTAVALTRTSPIPVDGASHWVRIKQGKPLSDEVLARNYTLRNHAYHDDYTPVVAPGWQAGERIYLLEKDEMVAPGQDAKNGPDQAGPIEGKLSFGGPREEVAQAFLRDGYEVGPWTAVLRRDPDLQGKIPGDDIWTDGLLPGGLLAALFLLIALIHQFRLRRILSGKS